MKSPTHRSLLGALLSLAGSPPAPARQLPRLVASDTTGSVYDPTLQPAWRTRTADQNASARNVRRQQLLAERKARKAIARRNKTQS